MLVASAVSVAAWLAGAPAAAQERLSLATAWLCFALLVAALSLGAAKALQSGRPVINNLLRRDLGIWAALTGLAHLVVATAVVMQPAYFQAYITGPPEAPMPGWAGWIGTASIVAGYVVGLLFLALLGLSNNFALRRLGATRWRKLQGVARWAFALTAAHGVIFQVIEGRTGAWLVALVVVTAAVLVLRRRASRLVAVNAS